MEDRKINSVRAKELMGVWGTKGIPVFKQEHSEHKANIKSIDRHSKLAQKKHSMAAKMHILKQAGQRAEKLAKRF